MTAPEIQQLREMLDDYAEGRTLHQRIANRFSSYQEAEAEKKRCLALLTKFKEELDIWELASADLGAFEGLLGEAETH